MPTPHSSIKAAALIIALLLFTACGPQSAKRAGQGAAVGGVSGAAAGMVSALIWGGNVGEAAARGAVWQPHPVSRGRLADTIHHRCGVVALSTVGHRSAR